MVIRNRFLISLAAAGLTAAVLSLGIQADTGSVDHSDAAESHSHDMRHHHQSMTAEDKEARRQQMRERHEQMTPEEREALRAKRQERREQYRDMTVEERQARHQEMCMEKHNLSAEECATKHAEMKDRQKEKKPHKHQGKRQQKHGDKAD